LGFEVFFFLIAFWLLFFESGEREDDFLRGIVGCNEFLARAFERERFLRPKLLEDVLPARLK